jgi:hypothetical protein
MKINQIVGEHKKGFKAKIYQKKQTVAPKKPLKPNEIEHPGHVDEAQVTPATVSAVDQNTGEVKLKNPDGTETDVAPNALQKGPDGKLLTKVAAAKPGDQVNVEKEMEEEMAPEKTFAGHAVGQKSGIAGQARGEPSRSQKAPLKGKLVGGMEEGMTPADKVLLDKMLTIAGLK